MGAFFVVGAKHDRRYLWLKAEIYYGHASPLIRGYILGDICG